MEYVTGNITNTLVADVEINIVLFNENKKYKEKKRKIENESYRIG